MLSRREFLLAAALLPGCGTSAQATLTPVDNKVLLTFRQFPALMAAGGSAVVDLRNLFPIIVVRTDAASATALSATCTHAGCLVEYRSDIHCPCHDANFGLDGTVLGGPTNIPLPVYAATLGADGITVDLS